jgi:hypothetical protein
MKKLYTKPQMKKALVAAGITEFEISGTKGNMSITIMHPDETDLVEKIDLTGWGGNTTGWGGLVMRANYVDKGDWNDKTSMWHY